MSKIYNWHILTQSRTQRSRTTIFNPFYTGAVFTEAKPGINDPELNQRRQFCPDFQFVWTKWSRWRKLLSHWLLWRAGLWFQPIVSEFLHCRKLFMNSTNFQQKILDYLISIISSRSFPHCEYRLRKDEEREWTTTTFETGVARQTLI